MVHSFCLSEREMDTRNFNDKTSFMAPIIVESNFGYSFLVAYEHGFQTPDLFLKYSISPDNSIALNAVKGNYASVFPITKENSYQPVWLIAAFIKGSEDLLAKNYRQFILLNMSPNSESRKPFTCYCNTKFGCYGC